VMIHTRSITEIAYASGFGSLASFRRRFIAHTGSSDVRREERSHHPRQRVVPRAHPTLTSR
jgi:AraC-like DNA-binding protein